MEIYSESTEAFLLDLEIILHLRYNFFTLEDISVLKHQIDFISISTSININIGLPGCEARL